jgi:IS605 OrfB family transposase
VPCTKEIEEPNLFNVKNVFGVDLGMNFISTSYDSKGKTQFYAGRFMKDKRNHYKKIRKQLQQVGTPSSRRRLKAIGQRENRWMQDVNHCVSKALVEQAGKDSLIVLEDLTGIRNATEKHPKNNRYHAVSWAFYDLRKKIEYKAEKQGASVLFVKPHYTSQTCPKCGHTEASNRNKKTHTFKCKTCGYQSNDDRVAAMNLYRKGIDYLSELETLSESSSTSVQ